MSKRIGKMEQRSIEACAEIERYGSMDFAMIWNRSNTWGLCPSIKWHGEKAAHASGCGYDKESACLVDFLYPLAKDALKGCSGAGFSTVRDHLAKVGWKLEYTYCGKLEHGYRITRIEKENNEPNTTQNHAALQD